MVELPTDLLAALGRKYASAAFSSSDAAFSSSDAAFSSSSDDEDECILVQLDDEGNPIRRRPSGRPSGRASGTRTPPRQDDGQARPLPPEEGRPPLGGDEGRRTPPEQDEARRRLNGPRGSRLNMTWEELPVALRDHLEPRIQYKRDGVGFVHVGPQPGTGSGFQVQFCRGGTTVRLGTVAHAKVGALMVAAAVLDPELTAQRLACRDWLERMCVDEDAMDEWIRLTRT